MDGGITPSLESFVLVLELVFELPLENRASESRVNLPLSILIKCCNIESGRLSNVQVT